MRSYKSRKNRRVLRACVRTCHYHLLAGLSNMKHFLSLEPQTSNAKEKLASGIWERRIETERLGFSTDLSKHWIGWSCCWSIPPPFFLWSGRSLDRERKRRMKYKKRKKWRLLEIATSMQKEISLLFLPKQLSSLFRTTTDRQIDTVIRVRTRDFPLLALLLLSSIYL